MGGPHLYPCMIAFAELAPFASRRPKRLADEAYRKLLIRLGQYPEAGEPVEGTEHWREVRWADRSRGKRGGVRQVRYLVESPSRILLGDVFSKTEKPKLNAVEAAAAPEATPVREVLYSGGVLVEVREDGKTAWRLSDARAEDPSDFASVREALRQTQEGMAELMGVKLSTIRNWEQKRRIHRGPGAQLIRVAALRPEALLAIRETA